MTRIGLLGRVTTMSRVLHTKVYESNTVRPYVFRPGDGLGDRIRFQHLSTLMLG